MKHLYKSQKSTACRLAGVAGPLLALGLGLAGPPTARAQTWQSALAVGLGNSEVEATAVDAAGNVYVAGSFYGTIQVGSTTLTSAGQDEVFVAKWSSASRSFAWAQRAGGDDIDFPKALAISNGSVYVAGSFSSATATFGSQTLTNVNPGTTSRNADVFVWKLTDAGTSATTAWAVRAGGPDTDAAQALAVAGSTLYLGGIFYGTTILGATTLTSAGSSDAFAARLTDAGSTATINWAVRGGGPGADEVEALAAVGTSVYVAGTFENTATFSNSTLSVSSAGSEDVFVARLTDGGTTGTYSWVQRGGGTGRDFARGLAAAGSSVYLCGEFASATAAFGGTTLTNGGSGSTDGYVARLTDAGAAASFAWAQRLGGPGYDNAEAVAVRGSSVYVAGHFDGAIISLGSTTLANGGAAGTYDLYVGRLLDAGSTASFGWGLRAGSADNDFLRALAIGGTSLYVGGSVGLPATFGSQALAGAAGASASFVATVLDVAGLPARATADLPGLSIYPNPAPGAATVRVPSGAGAATVQVFDALGRVVRSDAVAAGADCRLAGLAPGLYAVRVQVDGAAATRQLAVE